MASRLVSGAHEESAAELMSLSVLHTKSQHQTWWLNLWLGCKGIICFGLSEKEPFHLPSISKPAQTPTDGTSQQPAGKRLSSYWPERAGGHSPRGSGQTCTHPCDLHWCKWSPDETASPLLCRCRELEQVQWAPVQNPRRTHAASECTSTIAAVITCRWIRPWLQRLAGDEAGRRCSLFSCVCVSVWAVTFGIKAGGDVGKQPRTKFIWLAEADVCKGMFLWVSDSSSSVCSCSCHGSRTTWLHRVIRYVVWFNVSFDLNGCMTRVLLGAGLRDYGS